MQPSQLKRNICRLYLILVPVLVALAGFGIGHISYKIYLPIWLLNVCGMFAAAWILGARFIRGQDPDKKQLAFPALLLIIPWMLISMFFGLGPPPADAGGWAALAIEQQVRYSFLIAAGISIAFGFALLKEKLRNDGENFFSRLGFTAFMIAVPLFILNMTFWGSYIVETSEIVAASGYEKMPEWYQPLRNQFELISVVEVALTYIATAFFAASMISAGWFRKAAGRIYILLSLLGALIILLPLSNEPFATAEFAVSIPAIPFLLPYYMGINLLRKVG